MAPRLIRLGGRVDELALLAEADPARRDAAVAAIFDVDQVPG